MKIVLVDKMHHTRILNKKYFDVGMVMNMGIIDVREQMCISILLGNADIGNLELEYLKIIKCDVYA